MLRRSIHWNFCFLCLLLLGGDIHPFFVSLFVFVFFAASFPASTKPANVSLPFVFLVSPSGFFFLFVVFFFVVIVFIRETKETSHTFQIILLFFQERIIRCFVVDHRPLSKRCVPSSESSSTRCLPQIHDARMDERRPERDEE